MRLVSWNQLLSIVTYFLEELLFTWVNPLLDYDFWIDLLYREPIKKLPVKKKNTRQRGFFTESQPKNSRQNQGLLAKKIKKLLS
jgi:hypothetical protein